MKGRKTGGRLKGTPNKITQEVRDSINAFINGHIGDLQAIYSDLAPRDRMRFILDLLPFIAPKFQAIQMDIQHNEPTLVTITLPTDKIPSFPADL